MNTPKKICVVTNSLGKGGAERSSALLTYMFEALGFEVHIVTVLDDIRYSYKGVLFNLGKLKNNSVFNRLKRFLIFKRYIKAHKFSYIVDNRTRVGFVKEFLISKCLYTPSRSIYCVRNYNTNDYIHPNKIWAKFIYGNACKVVGVSEAIAQKLKNRYNFSNITYIYNAIDQTVATSDNPHNGIPYILFFGRLNNTSKNILFLLRCYAASVLPKRGIALKILGDGPDEVMLKQCVVDLGLQNHVLFEPYNANPFRIVANAMFTVLTSNYEGFPRVLIESLALGVPVVSVNCKSGPNEIITHKHNGLLIESHNASLYTEALNTFVLNKTLYTHCKHSAKASVAKFSKEHIAKQWAKLLN